MAAIIAGSLATLPARSLRQTVALGPIPLSRSSIWRLISPAATLPAIAIGIRGWLSDIWEGVLRAVPKKKTSHAKRRHRQLAGKALKDVKGINSCPGCGKPKKSHTLCPYCVSEIQSGWRDADMAKRQAAREAARDAGRP